MKNQFPREFYVPKGAVKVADKESTAVAFLYQAKNANPGAVCFQGKADKPTHHYTFRDEARREKFVRQHFEAVRAREARRVEAREKRKAFVHQVKAGDIYRTSWGYDQTNVEFFQVVEVKGKYAILREIEGAAEYRGQGCDSVAAVAGSFLEPRGEHDDRGRPIRRLIQDGRIKIDDVRTAWPWGQRLASGVVIGKPCHATAPGWGH